MKRFLSAGERCVNPWVSLPLIFVFCFHMVHAESIISSTQQNHVILNQISDVSSKYSKLQIGHKVPRNVLIGEPVYNSNKKTVSTRDFRRRAVIIDVWATWCGSCINQFPKLDSLQRVYENHLDIYLLNNLYRDSGESIASFHEDFKLRFPEFSLPLIVGNVNSRALFPGKTLPHYIWIDANGRVKAITDGEDVTGANIERLIAGLSVDAKEKLR